MKQVGERGALIRIHPERIVSCGIEERRLARTANMKGAGDSSVNTVDVSKRSRNDRETTDASSELLDRYGEIAATSLAGKPLHRRIAPHRQDERLRRLGLCECKGAYTVSATAGSGWQLGEDGEVLLPTCPSVF